MERGHDVSKAAEKSGSPPLRRNATPPISSGASAVLNLQRAAGNQAVARMLAGQSAGGLRPPITVQRETWEEAVKKAMEGQYVDLDDFAQKLVTKMKEPAASSKQGHPSISLTQSEATD